VEEWGVGCKVDGAEANLWPVAERTGEATADVEAIAASNRTMNKFRNMMGDSGEIRATSL
jgi:hypothetical protein